VSGMGGLTWADAESAQRLVPSGDGVTVAIETVRPRAATVVLRQGGVEVARWSADIAPGHPFRADWGPGAGPWELGLIAP